MAAVRLIRMSTPPSALDAPSLGTLLTMRVRVRLTCMVVGFGSKNDQLVGDVERKPVAITKAATTTTTTMVVVMDRAPTQTSERLDLATLMVYVRTAILRKLKVVKRRKPWSLIIQSLVEKVIMDSRFFTMFGVAGTLVGSVLCFLEGIFLVMESYLQYFHAISHHSDHGHIIYRLIEALDMFLIGTAMLTFGMGLHVMFVGSKGNGSPLPSSNLFGLYHLKEFPSWAGMKSISEAKSKMGHALMMLLQVGLLEKLKSIPLATGLDLACFAASIFVSSAALFILSRLSVARH